MVMKSTLKPCLHSMALIAVDLLLDLVEDAGPELSDVPSNEHPGPLRACLACTAVFVLVHCR